MEFSFGGLGTRRKTPRATKTLEFLELVKRWGEVIGPRNAERTIPLKHKGKILTVLTEHPSYSQQLKFLSPMIMEKISEKFPSFGQKLEKIHFTSDSTFFEHKAQALSQPPGPKLHPQSPQYHQVVKEFEEEFSYMQDKGLKEALKSLFVQIKAHGPVS